MSRITFDNYGSYAEQNFNYTLMAGRYSMQEDDQKNIIYDIINKLKLNSKDDLLEIGCGPGNLLIPLSFLVNRAVGVDHPNTLKTLGLRFNDKLIEKIPGNFLDINIDKTFSKILIYGVLDCLESEQEIIYFIEKAASLLKLGGIMLLGDLANVDKKRRFLSTKHGQEFLKQWSNISRETDLNKWQNIDVKDTKLVEFTDELVTKVLLCFRQKGFQSYVVPQANNLPFCFTREDIIIEKLAE